jgi:pimeloyl-ACP methyl ester carboxylesterase
MGTRRAVTLALAGGAAGAVATAVASLSGCASIAGPSRKTMDVIRDDSGCAKTLAPTLLVFLPGANMAPAELVQEGFVAAVRQRGLAIDLALPDAHLGYVYDGSMLQRLRQDVIEPALAQGRRQIWLAGISLGGFVALGYARNHPQQIAGVLAIAPYLGRRPLLKTIAEAGGPAVWRRSAQPRDAQDIDHDLWMWLSDPQRGGPPIWLGYGTEDRLADGHRLLAGVLPAAQVSTAPGDHDWPPWRTLWAQWLDRGLLPGSPGGPGGAAACS